MKLKKIFTPLFFLLFIAWSPTEWTKAGDYSVKVHSAMFESVKNYKGENENIFYLDVECRNDGSKTASCRGSQWQVFDTENYKYEYEYAPTYLYQDKGRPSLTETILNPGDSTRGWLAFKIPVGKTVKRFQFFSGYMSAHVASFQFSETK